MSELQLLICMGFIAMAALGLVVAFAPVRSSQFTKEQERWRES